MKNNNRLLRISPLNVSHNIDRKTLCNASLDASQPHNVFFVVTSFPLSALSQHEIYNSGVKSLFCYNENFLLTACVVAKLKFIWAARVDVRGFNDRKIAFITQRTQ
jgi:hypothetical protein